MDDSTDPRETASMQQAAARGKRRRENLELITAMHRSMTSNTATMSPHALISLSFRNATASKRRKQVIAQARTQPRHKGAFVTVWESKNLAGSAILVGLSDEKEVTVVVYEDESEQYVRRLSAKASYMEIEEDEDSDAREAKMRK